MRVAQWIVAIVLVVVALIICIPGWIILTIILSPEEGPPQIVEELTGKLRAPNSGNVAEIDKNLIALLRRKFPVGTSEDSLKSTLLAQGFKPLPAPKADCIPPGQPPPMGRTITMCPTEDQSKILEYRWSRFPCASSIRVRWEVGDQREITYLAPRYGGWVCL
jgi:hypothetical protein